MHSIDFDANLLKHCVKLCAETISQAGYRPFDWIGLWPLMDNRTDGIFCVLGAVLIKNYSSFEKYVKKVPRGFS